MTSEMKKLMDEIEAARKAMDALYKDTCEYPTTDTMDDDELAEICEFTGNDEAEYIVLANSLAKQYSESKARWTEISKRNLPVLEAMRK